MFDTFKKLLLTAPVVVGLVITPATAASATPPAQSVQSMVISQSVSAPTAAKVVVPMAAKKKAKAKVRKCKLKVVCTWTYGGEIRNDHTSKKSVMISDGIDQHGKPYGNKATLKPGRNSLEKFSDTDMVYLSKKDIDNGWRLERWRHAKYRVPGKFITLSAKDSAGFKVHNTRKQSDYSLFRAVKIK